MSKTGFIKFALVHRVLQFGDFTLKSGRHSPYFFDLGAICTGTTLAELGRFYADAIAASGIEFDVLFGPAYKGIPLAGVAATCLHERHDLDKGVAYNRKEVKDHGEGGRLVGASLRSRRVLIVDDVMTVGTAAHEAVRLIADAGGEAVGVAVAFDRREKGAGGVAATDEFERTHGFEVIRISDFHDLLACVDGDERACLKAYFERHGAG